MNKLRIYRVNSIDSKFITPRIKCYLFNREENNEIIDTIPYLKIIPQVINLYYSNNNSNYAPSSADVQIKSNYPWELEDYPVDIFDIERSNEGNNGTLHISLKKENISTDELFDIVLYIEEENIELVAALQVIRIGDRETFNSKDGTPINTKDGDTFNVLKNN